MANSDHSGFLEQKRRDDRIKARDDYTCLKCGIKEGLPIFQGQIIAPSYAETDGSTFIVYHPHVKKKDWDLPATPENVRSVSFSRHEGTFEEAKNYPYHFKYKSTESKTDGFELSREVEAYLVRNPNPLEGGGFIKLSIITACLYVDFIDGNPQNNTDSNLQSLCQFCYNNIKDKGYLNL